LLGGVLLRVGELLLLVDRELQELIDVLLLLLLLLLGTIRALTFFRESSMLIWIDWTFFNLILLISIVIATRDK